MESIRSWATPTNRKEIEAFLRFMNYHRGFIPGFAYLADSLCSLTGPKVRFQWTIRHREAFES